MNVQDAVRVTGRVLVRAHPPNEPYRRDAPGRVLATGRNTIQSPGLAHIAQMLLADPDAEPALYGITQISISTNEAEQVYKAPLTDQYISSGDVVNVLYVPSAQPATQPHTIASARLWLGDAGTVPLSLKTFAPTFEKTNLVAMTVEWTISLTAG